MKTLTTKALPEHALLDTHQVARLLSLSTTSLRRWRAQGKGPKFLVLNGRTIRYRLEDVKEFLGATEIYPPARLTGIP